MPLVYLNKQQSYDITSKACTLVTFSTWFRKKTMDSKNILNLKLLKYQMKVPTQDVDLKYGSILDSN